MNQQPGTERRYPARYAWLARDVAGVAAVGVASLDLPVATLDDDADLEFAPPAVVLGVLVLVTMVLSIMFILGNPRA